MRKGRYLPRSLVEAYPGEGLSGGFGEGVMLPDILHPIDMYRVFHVLDLSTSDEFAVAVIPYALICLRP